MVRASASALVTDEGRRVLLRVCGKYFELSQPELREVLGLPAGPLGVGITVDHDRLHFEFVEDNQNVELSATQLHRRLANYSTSKAQ
jgi:hypothetical protein